MTILTLSVESIFVFKSKRAAIVIWSPSLAARKKALSRYKSSTEWIKKYRAEFDDASGESWIERDSVPCFDHMNSHISHTIFIGMT